jgi:GNAT superfamily N-acetyltransferase
MRAQEFIQEVKARYEMTDLDPWTFDQTPAGWRGLPSSARQADALNQYIDRYVKDGQFVGAPEGVKTVRPYILYWHLGQVLTQMGRNGMAARVMRQALDDSDPNWNAYVMATVSFLRKDRKDFDHWAPLARGNEETIKRLTDGWGRPYKQVYAGQQGVAEDSFQGIDISVEREEDEIMVQASAGGRTLGSVLFVDYDGALMPQDLEVDERYRGQGIAAAMYDYVKSLGYKIRRSGQQTDAGAGFWAKHRPDSNVWEQGVTDGSVTKKPQPYNDPNWAKKLPKEKLNALAGPRYKKDTKEQGVTEDIDPYRLERLDPQTRRVLTRMADHKDPGSWLSASEAYAMSLGLQYKNRDPRGWEQDVQRYVDLYRQYSGQGISEVKILSKVKGKGSEPGQLPRFGRPIDPGEETRYLGTKVADWQGREIWRDYLGGQLSYHLFDPDTRTVIVTTFGSRYKNNPRSYIIHGLYAAPGNPVRAAEFYRALIKELGLTLISDRKQSPGGNRVWQQLEQFPDVEVYGYDTNTDQALNFGAGDVEMYTVPSAAVAGSKEMQRVARDLRLVATAR